MTESLSKQVSGNTHILPFAYHHLFQPITSWSTQTSRVNHHQQVAGQEARAVIAPPGAFSTLSPYISPVRQQKT
jgi:hypothetical protein